MGYIARFQADFYCDHPDHYDPCGRQDRAVLNITGTGLTDCVNQLRKQGWSITIANKLAPVTGMGRCICPWCKKGICQQERKALGGCRLYSISRWDLSKILMNLSQSL